MSKNDPFSRDHDKVIGDATGNKKDSFDGFDSFSFDRPRYNDGATRYNDRYTSYRREYPPVRPRNTLDDDDFDGGVVTASHRSLANPFKDGRIKPEQVAIVEFPNHGRRLYIIEKTAENSYLHHSVIENGLSQMAFAEGITKYPSTKIKTETFSYFIAEVQTSLGRVTSSMTAEFPATFHFAEDKS